MTGVFGAAGSSRNGTVSLANSNAYASATSPATAEAVYALTEGGVVQSSNNSNTNWIDPQIGMVKFEVRATLNSGSLTSGTVGSWLSLDAARSWSVFRSLAGAQTANLTIEIRRIGTTTILATATINISVDIF